MNTTISRRSAIGSVLALVAGCFWPKSGPAPCEEKTYILQYDIDELYAPLYGGFGPKNLDAFTNKDMAIMAGIAAQNGLLAIGEAESLTTPASDSKI